VPAIWHSAKHILKLKKNLCRVPDRGHSAKRRNKRPARLLLSPSSPLTRLCHRCSPCAAASSAVRRPSSAVRRRLVRRAPPLARRAPPRRAPPTSWADVVRPSPNPPARRRCRAPLPLPRPPTLRHRRCAPSPPSLRPVTATAATRPQPSSPRLALNRRRARHHTAVW
jgi:hypothetical protein